MSHNREEHDTSSKMPYERAKQILARELCSWISGHGAPATHFLSDAELILESMHQEGVRFHLVGNNANSVDGFVEQLQFNLEI
jgi:hypothetical protein